MPTDLNISDILSSISEGLTNLGKETADIDAALLSLEDELKIEKYI